MLIVIDTDLDSGMTNENGIKLEPFIYGSGFAYLIKNKKEKELFIQNWYERKFGLNDKVYNVLIHLFSDTNLIESIMNDNFESYENGNYSINLLDETRISQNKEKI